jgi:N-acetylmuramoyl-L-alanine amidase
VSGGAGPSALAGHLIDRSRASPNHGARATAPDMLVLHYTGMRDGPSAVDWLCNPVSQVSCHYVVAEDGRILQLVDEERRAWHAGRSFWAGLTDINSASIGIEIVNGGHDFGLPPFPDAQIAAVIDLCCSLVGRFDIPPERVLAHSDVAPSRKRDPGERFPWRRLARAGVGRWVELDPKPPGDTLERGSADGAIEPLKRALATYGYGVNATAEFDEETETTVRAFQRHFRPSTIDGRADPETRALVHRLVGTSA